jgi:Flp pilus assembly pilin Flp
MRFFLSKIFHHLKRSRRGQTLVEYSLILAIIGIVLIAVFALLSKEIIIVFSAITTLLDSAQSSSF